jgi:hypothetical protein
MSETVRLIEAWPDLTGCECPRIYVSGPMNGIPDLNFPAFEEATAALRRRGYVALCPAAMAQAIPGLSYAEYLQLDLCLVRMANAVLRLPGWRQSKGARAEVALADCIGIPLLGAQE